jgi:hypothetical protein
VTVVERPLLPLSARRTIMPASGNRWRLRHGFGTMRGMDLRDLRSGFRDDDQRHRVGMVIHRRLADDREQDECRHLLRFQWQLSMTYTEVTVDELRAHVRAEKLAVVEALIDALRSSPDDVERWIQETVRSFPEVQDRGFQQWNNLGDAGPTET